MHLTRCRPNEKKAIEVHVAYRSARELSLSPNVNEISKDHFVRVIDCLLNLHGSHLSHSAEQIRISILPGGRTYYALIIALLVTCSERIVWDKNDARVYLHNGVSKASLRAIALRFKFKWSLKTLEKAQPPPLS